MSSPISHLQIMKITNHAMFASQANHSINSYSLHHLPPAGDMHCRVERRHNALPSIVQDLRVQFDLDQSSRSARAHHNLIKAFFPTDVFLFIFYDPVHSFFYYSLPSTAFATNIHYQMRAHETSHRILAGNKRSLLAVKSFELAMTLNSNKQCLRAGYFLSLFKG